MIVFLFDVYLSCRLLLLCALVQVALVIISIFWTCIENLVGLHLESLVESCLPIQPEIPNTFPTPHTRNILPSQRLSWPRRTYLFVCGRLSHPWSSKFDFDETYALFELFCTFAHTPFADNNRRRSSLIGGGAMAGPPGPACRAAPAGTAGRQLRGPAHPRSRRARHRLLRCAHRHFHHPLLCPGR